MNKLKVLMIAAMFAVFFTPFASASSISSSDMDFAFGNNNQLSSIELLDVNEMQATEGKYWDIRFTVCGIGCHIGYHSAHHPFNGVYRTHLQFGYWQSGVRNSYKAYRIGLWR